MKSIYEQALGEKFTLLHPRIRESFGFSRSNLARGANSLFNQLVTDCSFSIFGDRKKNVGSVLGFSKSEPTRAAQNPDVSAKALCGKAQLFGSKPYARPSAQ
jgi:hypothetical protein